MVSLNRKIFKSSFTVVCVIVVVFMVGYWFYKYKYEDRDIGVVDYAMLMEAEDVEVPAVSLCFENPFIVANLSTTSSYVSKERYLDYLKGTFFDEVTQQIDYTKVTLDLGQYFLMAQAGYRNETGHIDLIKIGINHTESFNGFGSFHSFLKCFTMRYEGKDYRKIKFIQIDYNKTGLLADWQNETDWQDNSMRFFHVIVHHPGQFLIDVPDDMKMFNEKLNFDHWDATHIHFTEYEILQRRNSRKRKCVDKTNDYDNVVIAELLKRSGCRPTYHKGHNFYPRCNSKEKMIESKIETDTREKLGIHMACQRISKINHKLDYERYTEGMEIHELLIYYPDEVRIITQSKDIDIHSLIGNVGGYLGLFLGRLFIRI